MNGWVWLAAGALLGLTELAVPGLYLAFFAAAAALTGLLVLIVPGAPILVQAASFALSSVAAVALGRRLYAERPVATTDPLLNDRVERLIGSVVTVEQPIVGGLGRVRVGDGGWPASGPDAPVGEAMEVVGYDDGRLVVAPITALPSPGAVQAG